MRPGPGLFQVRVLWAAFLVSQGIYVGIVLGHLLQPPPEPPEPILLTAIAAVATMVGAASLFLPRVFHAQSMSQVSEHDLAAARESRDALLRISFSRGFAPYIIGLALNEAVAIFGLVLSALGFASISIAPFFAASVVLMFARIPMEGWFVRPLEERLAGLRR